MTDGEEVLALDPEEFTDLSPDPPSDPTLSILCDALQEIGIRRFVIDYDGYGDSQNVCDSSYEPEGTVVPDRFDRALRDLADHYTPSGYENNDGGHGHLTVYPFDGLAELEHCDRYQGSESLDTRETTLPRRLLRQLRRLGVICLNIRFDGYGDSGQIEELTAEPASVSLEQTLRTELEEYLVNRLPGGWEINEGSHGDIEVDVQSGRIKVSGSWRVDKEFDPVITRWRWRP